MATAVKRRLSGSTSGKAIKIAATATPGTAIHTALDSSVEGSFDEIWLWASNSYVANVAIMLEFGGVDVPDNTIAVTIPGQSGLVPILPGLILQNNLEVKAFASLANAVTLIGFVNRIAD